MKTIRLNRLFNSESGNCFDVAIDHGFFNEYNFLHGIKRGGGKASDEEILKRTYELMQQGVKGIVYGRNVIQHQNPAGITKALMGIVHENKGVEESLELLRHNRV